MKTARFRNFYDLCGRITRVFKCPRLARTPCRERTRMIYSSKQFKRSSSQHWSSNCSKVLPRPENYRLRLISIL